MRSGGIRDDMRTESKLCDELRMCAGDGTTCEQDE